METLTKTSEIDTPTGCGTDSPFPTYAPYAHYSDEDELGEMDCVEHGIRGLLVGSQFLQDVVLEEPEIAAPMAYELRPLFAMTCDFALTGKPDAVSGLREAGSHLEDTIRLLEGHFKKWMIQNAVKNLIGTLEDLL